MDQNKISKRQLTRMIYIEGFGVSGLTLPAAAAWQSTSEGLIPMLCYGVFLALYTAYFLFLLEKCERETAAQNVFVVKKWVGIIYLVRYLIHGAILFYFFGFFIQTIYMPDTGMLQILLPFAFLLWYCTGTTLQKRARFLELMFPWIAVLFVLLLFFAFLGLWGEAQRIPWTEDLYTALENGYLLLLCSTPLEFLYFLVPSVTDNLWEQSPAKNPEKVKKCVWKAVLGVYLWNVLLWFFTVETLGGALTASSPWPVIKMLQLIRMPGGFLERFDILLAVFWLLCLIGVLSGFLFYGKKIAEETLEMPGRIGVVILLFLVLAAYVFPIDSGKWMEVFLLYKKWIDFPLLLLLPLFARNSMDGNKKNHRKNIKTMVGLFVVVVASLSLSGCRSQDDVEEKSYVLSLYVDDCGADYEYWVAKADLSAMEEKEQSIPCTVIRLEGENMKEMEANYRKTEVGELEWNHIYTIFLGPNLIKNEEKLEQFLREWEASWQKSPNVLLTVCRQEADALYELKHLPQGSAGQEVSRLAEQAEEKKEQATEDDPILCRTPMEVLKAKEQGCREIGLYQTKIRQDQIILGSELVYIQGSGLVNNTDSSLL